MQQLAILLLIAIQFSDIHAYNHHHPPNSGPSPISEDPKSSRYDPSPKIPGIQDYPNDRMLLNSIMHSSVLNDDSLASPLAMHRLINSPLIRKARAASANSQEFLDHVGIIARIANGISLQAGLMNDKINIEEVAGELLNFGDVPVSTIAKFKPEVVKNFVTKLKEIPANLDSTFVTQEKQFSEWVELHKSSKTIGNVTDLSAKDKYFTVLKTLNSSDFESLTDPSRYIEKAKNEIENLKDPKTKVNSIVRSFQELSELFENFHNSIEPFKTTMERLKSSQVGNAPEVFTATEKTIKLIPKRMNFTTGFTDEGKEATVSNLKSLLLLSADSKGSIQEVNTLTSLSKTKSTPEFQKRKFTEGFPKGVEDVNQLARDVLNPWIGKIIRVDKSLDALNNGLLPLFKVNKRLGELDKKLGIFSTRPLFQSLSRIQTVQRKLSEIEPGVDEMTGSVWVDLETCKNDYNRIVESNKLVPIQAVINAVRALAQIADFKLNEVNFAEHKTKIDQFIKSLGFTDLNNPTESANQVPGIMERLKENKELDKIEQTIDNLIDMFAHFKDFETKVKDVVSKENTPIPAQITNEHNLYRCLENIQNIDKVAKAISVAHKLRSQKNDNATAVDSAIAAVSSVSKDFSNLGSLTSDTTKHSGDASTDLNKFSDSAAQSKIIGQSAVSLRFAHGLKELDSEISHLKTIDPIVKAEIQKVFDPAETKDLPAQWGDHKSHMSSLDQALSGILSFESKLDVSNAKTLEEFSNPLKNLGTIPDAKINALEKSKVLEALIAQPQIDPKVKSELEKAKQTLDKLALLDLGFAAHQSEFEKAPSAFKAFQDFLVGFLTNHNSETSGPAKDSDHTTMYIVFGVVGFVLIGVSIGGGIGAFFWRRKRQQEKEEQKAQEEHNLRQRQQELDALDQERRARDEREAERLAAIDDERRREREALLAQNREEREAREQAEAGLQAAEAGRQAAEAGRQAAEAERKRALVAARKATKKYNTERFERRRAVVNKKIATGKLNIQQRQEEKQFNDEIGKMNKSVAKYVANSKFKSTSQMCDSLGDQMNTAQKIAQRGLGDLRNASWKLLTREKHRYPDTIPLIIKTALPITYRHNHVPIHANKLTTKATYLPLATYSTTSKPQKVSREFIAAQGPLENTLDDFLCMIWVHRFETIVMLCDFNEGGIEKCARYLNNETGMGIESDQFVITTTRSGKLTLNNRNVGVSRTLKIRRKE
ncbi:hypothetical protein B9Z55_015990 [Caenorhabditis nigoni]|uniref:Tyrosine-protein phosphatase domain-containing protein n=1 Tax=Caenorhabditis nigoni TaxID=1611254 RepID=A0A2G5UCQ5_9PELO|nr:hypothetical protein B9Z55_015990 [Caenorhabditis nigoni]